MVLELGGDSARLKECPCFSNTTSLMSHSRDAEVRLCCGDSPCSEAFLPLTTDRGCEGQSSSRSVHAAGEAEE